MREERVNITYNLIELCLVQTNIFSTAFILIVQCLLLDRRKKSYINADSENVWVTVTKKTKSLRSIMGACSSKEISEK